MREMVTTVGPLIASSATKFGASQKAAATGTNYLVLNGAGTDAASTAVCAAQTPSGAGALTLNGSKVIAGVAYMVSPRRLYLTCVADESGRLITITGTSLSPGPNQTPYGVTEVVTGANASLVSTTNLFFTVSSVTIDGAGTGNISVGMGGVATADSARQLLITNGGNDATTVFTVEGTIPGGTFVSEAITGTSGSTVASKNSWLTITAVKSSAAVATVVSLGTNGVATSPWVGFDLYATSSATSIQVNATGTVNWTIQQTLDDPNSTAGPTAIEDMTWVSHADSALVGATTTTGVQGNYAYIPRYARILLNSGSGTVTAKFIQVGAT